MTARRMPPRLGVLFAIVLWGLSFVATKMALREISPLTLIFTRFALGTALLVGTLAVRRRPLVPPLSSWGALAVMGFFGIFLHQLLQSYGIKLTSAVHAGWIIGLIPIWSALLAALFLGERFGLAKVAGLAVGFAGAVLVVTRGRVGPGFLALPATRGDLLMLVSTLNWAVYTALGHGTIRRLGSLRATAGAMFLGWLMLAPLYLRTAGWREYPALSGTGIAAVLFLGIGPSGLGYLFWYAALDRIETSRVAVFLYLEPLVTLAAAVALLHEPVGAATLIGGLLVLAGVALVQRAPAAGAARNGPAAEETATRKETKA
jgi:drug/metabolite transporter (DMT)-like permease